MREELNETSAETKTCPMCAEDVQTAAVIWTLRDGMDARRGGDVAPLT
jgi:hypothetical protein